MTKFLPGQVYNGPDKWKVHGGKKMIDFEEELKKFEPCLDVTDAEGAIYEKELTDILDVLQEVLREAKGSRRVK